MTLFKQESQKKKIERGEGGGAPYLYFLRKINKLETLKQHSILCYQCNSVLEEFSSLVALLENLSMRAPPFPTLYFIYVFTLIKAIFLMKIILKAIKNIAIEKVSHC